MGFLSGKKGKKEKKEKKAAQSKSTGGKGEAVDGGPATSVWRQLLVMDGDVQHDWVSTFAGFRLNDGSGIRVVQASWMEIDVVVYADSGCQVSAAPVRETEGTTTRPATLTLKPDFVLMRNQPRGPTPGSDRRNQLFGLMNANIPAINSLVSEYMNLERPIMMGGLREIEARLGHDAFPLIDYTYYASPNTMVIAPELPGIVKVWHAHAGMGKMKIDDNAQFRDLATVLAVAPAPVYASGEPYFFAEYGIRVQRIGPHLRVYKKIFTGSGWKSQFGGADLQNVSPDDEEWPKFAAWADAVSQSSFGQGMQMFAIDALHTKEGEDVIIELNGTAIGFHANYYTEDEGHVKEVVCDHLQKVLDERSERSKQRQQKSAAAATDSNSSSSSGSESSKSDEEAKSEGKSKSKSKSKKASKKKKAGTKPKNASSQKAESSSSSSNEI